MMAAGFRMHCRLGIPLAVAYHTAVLSCALASASVNDANATGSASASAAEHPALVIPHSAKAWLRARTSAAFAGWQDEFARTIDTGTWVERAERQRAYLTNALGGLPSTRTDLNAKVHRVHTMPGYRIEAVRYESQPGFVVTASLYLPDDASATHQVPGIVIPCGHAQVAKAFDEYQAAAALLALNGIAALVYDPLDQGERIQRFDATGEVISDGVNAHMQEGMAALLLGWNLARIMVWDGMRSLDYLAGRPEVDASRLAVTGHSGGGTLTAFLFALDPRLKAAAPCCFISQAHYELWHASTGGEIDSEQLLFGQLSHGFEHADFFLTRPAAPVLLLAATRDTNDIASTWATFRALKRAFTSQDVPERVDLVEDAVPHSYSRKHREAMVEWMLRWLTGEARSVQEPTIAMLPEQDLFATPEGQVLRIPGSRSIWDLLREEATRLARERGRPSDEELRRRIRLASGIDDRPMTPRVEAESSSNEPPTGYSERRLRLVRSDRPVPVEIILWEPLASSPRDGRIPVLFLGSRPPAPESGSVSEFVRERRTIVIARTFGTLADPAPDQAALEDEFGGLTKAEWVALYELGESPVRHRAEDVLLASRHLVAAGIASGGRIDLVAEGVMAVPALHAAMLAPDLFAHATVRRSPQRWDEFFTLERSYGMIENFIPSVLRSYDLPDLTAALGADLRVENPVNLLNLETDLENARLDPAFDAPARHGLVGLLFGGGDLRNPREIDVRYETGGTWQGRGGSWSAEWQGFILGPVEGEVEFVATTNRQAEVIIGDRVVVSRTDLPGTARGRAILNKDQATPIIVRFFQSEGNEGTLELSWAWPGHPLSLIRNTHLRHSPRQAEACRIAVRR